MLLPRFASRRAALASALLLALSSTVAFAADPQCRDADGDVILPAPNTDQGTEAGVDNASCHANALAFGRGNIAGADRSVAVGRVNWALGIGSAAIGNSNTALGEASTAVGRANWAFGLRSQAYGSNAVATGESSVAFGSWFDRNNDGLVNLDLDLDGDGVMETTSEGTFARGRYALALGAGADAVADNAIAIGSNSVANRGNAVSFGNAGLQRQLTNVADGTQEFDAVNLRQLNAAIAGSGADLSPFAAAFGGGASWNGGLFTPPSYTIQGVSYGDVGAALAAIDNWMTGNGNGVQYDDAGHGTVTLDGANGTQIKNVAEGTDPTDAVNLNQMEAGDMMAVAAAKKYADVGDDRTLASANSHADAGDAATLTASKTYTDDKAVQTLNSAKAYTDQKFAAWNDSFTQYQQQVDLRFNRTDARIDRSGAMQTAMAQMTASAAGVRTVNRVAVGVGAQNGKTALSVGYQRAIGDKAAFTIGGAFSGSERSAGVGYGFGW